MLSNRILIVEDEFIPATYLKRILSNIGYEVVDIAHSAKEAIDMTNVYKPDVVLMDIALEEKEDGCDAGLQIRKEHKEIKIIFLTAHSDADTLEKAMRCEPNGYILKPYNLEQIKVVLALESPIKQAPSKKDNDLIRLIDNYSFNIKHNRLFLEDTIEVEMGVKALKLIALLCETPNISISNEKIIASVYEKEIPIQTLRSLIHRIRQSSSSNLIKNVNGVGYKILCSS